jgi:hypothetical protein
MNDIRFIMISQETMETMLVPPVSKLIAEFDWDELRDDTSIFA